MHHINLTYLAATAKGMVPARLKTRDGATLAFKTLPARGQHWGTILVLHGMGMDSHYYLTLGNLLAAKGLNVALMDFRGHGDSSGVSGDANTLTDYRDDLREAVEAFQGDGPLFIFSHSGAAVAAIDLMSQDDAPEIAGYAMIAPTISGDSGLTRTPNPGVDVSAVSRYLLKFRPEKVLSAQAAKFCPKFNFKKFLLARATGLQSRLRVLSFESVRPNEPDFSYTARAATNMINTWPDTQLSKMRCPVFLITSKCDPIVNSDAIATRLPWAFGPDVALEHTVLPRGDHFTVTLLAAPLVATWLRTLCPSGDGECAA